ncbi:tRNA dihydrouridine(20/20a) synthase DusA [Maricaulis alexandrii]|uniref:tRNA dihydrouridine(20/20a) synthase DusA n=1 Tax=Maricaulis alexandrii TaxID=2570354 RepID=UPI0011085ED4|nr:tRNA dihydrouridine(20/20a) synthase DusA [Maricaulis alexandrii]
MTTPAHPDRRLSVAPMMDWTDRHCRAFHRVLTRQTLLYTEMAVDKAVIHGDRDKLIGFEADEHPVAIQLGGSDPQDLAEASRIAEGYGYHEINLNVGCPSDRVQSGRFGACLMQEPQLVADCVAAMQAAVSVPVTVKCRIGVDDQEPEEALFALVDTVRQAGVTSFTVHARKAWLKGLSPKENRSIPPLDYDLVRRLKAERPELEIILNGGLETLEQGLAETQELDGMMIGRAAYHTPFILAEADSRVFGAAADPFATRLDVVEAYKPYIARRLEQGSRLHDITRHMLGLFTGEPGARMWRRILSEKAPKRGAGLEIVDEALAAVTRRDEAA